MGEKEGSPELNFVKPKGIKKTLHGNMYQVKFSLSYGLTLWKNDVKGFKMESEMEEAGNFDDLVIMEDSKTTFVQLKHSKDRKNISLTDMLKISSRVKNPLSVLDYFSSFRMIDFLIL